LSKPVLAVVTSLVYRLRKALTTQLHTLRQELGPKEESLMRATEKLQETDREYELSLQVSVFARRCSDGSLV
jgi:hypothetical protein